MSAAVMTAARRAVVLEAQAGWKRWADDEQARADKGNAAQQSAAVGRRVVEAYDLELRTGTPHCACCLKPVSATQEVRR